MIKRGVCLLLITCLIMMLFTSTVFCIATVYYNVNLYEGGRIDITGNLSSGPGKQITLLVLKNNVEVNSSTIVYIDQQATTTNGTFLFRFTLPSTLRAQHLILK